MMPLLRVSRLSVRKSYALNSRWLSSVEMAPEIKETVFSLFASILFGKFISDIVQVVTPENKVKTELVSFFKPKEVVEQLNKFIVGQDDAKRAVAIALRNRWRRHQLGPEFRNEVLLTTMSTSGLSKTSRFRLFQRIF